MLVGIMGKMGTGKTLTQTILSNYLHFKTKVPIFANYTLKKVPYTYINKLSDLWKVNNGIICLDEIWLTMDSRLWKDNVALTRFINQTRKKKITLFYTTQHIKQVELRVRNATDVLIYCEKKENGHWLWFIDYQYGQIGKKFFLDNPQKFYDFYDTFEVLEPMKLDLPNSLLDTVPRDKQFGKFKMFKKKNNETN